MAKKSSPPKKKTSKPVRAAAAADSPKASSAKASASKTPKPKKSNGFYVTSAATRVAIVDAKPADSDNARAFATFEDAKSAAIDTLIAAIEQAERDLAELKRASSCGKTKANSQV